MTQNLGLIALHDNIIEPKTGGKLTYSGQRVVTLVPKSDVNIPFKLTQI
jgi:hypothetical protein